MAKGNIASLGVEPFLAAAIVLAVDDMRVMIMAVHWSDGSCSNALLCRAHNLATIYVGLGLQRSTCCCEGRGQAINPLRCG